MSRRKPCSSGMPFQPFFTVTRASVGEREGGDIERIAEGVLGNMRARIAVHAAAGIGGDLLDLDHAGAEPAHRCGLHGIGEPAIERRDDRTGQRRRGLHRDRTEAGDGIALRRPEPRQRPAAAGTFRIGRRIAIALRIGRRRAEGAPASALGGRSISSSSRRDAGRGQRNRSVRTARHSPAGASDRRDRRMARRRRAAAARPAAARPASAAGCRCCRAAASRRQNRSCRCFRRARPP